MIKHSKDRRAGYQGQPDAMREMADKLMNHPGQEEALPPSVMTSRRFLKKGGRVVKKDGQKFAAGGVAKIRHKQANAKGMPLTPPQRPLPREA